MYRITIPNTLGLTVDQVATLLNVNEKTIHRHTNLPDGDPKRLRAYRIGIGDKGDKRITAQDLLEYIQRNYLNRKAAIED